MPIANILTFGRLLLVPFFIYYFIIDYHFVAFILFVIAGFTDLVDGTIARFMNQTSAIGAFLDPLADKLLMLSTFACLVSVDVIPLAFFMLLIVRDFIIMGGIAFLRFIEADVAYKALWTSKFATLFQLLTAILAFIVLIWPSIYWFKWPVSFYMWGMILATTALILTSGIQYMVIGLKILKRKENSEKVL